MIDKNKMSINFLSYSVWLKTASATRYKIADLLGIKPRVTRHVVDGRVISDGFSPDDLAAITKEKMQELTGSKSDDFYVLFEELVKQVETNTLNKNADVQQEKQAEVNPGTEVKRGRKPKGGK